LVIAKEEKEPNKVLQDYLTNNLEGVKLLQEVSTEATYLLPKESAPLFKDFFPKFDEELKRLKVKSYGLSMTTLEEVFLRVEQEGAKKENNAEESEESDEEKKTEADAEVDAYSISKKQIPGVFKNFFIHLWALLVKRLHQTRRSLGTLAIELLVPLFLIIAGFGLTLVEFRYDSDSRFAEI